MLTDVRSRAWDYPQALCHVQMSECELQSRRRGELDSRKVTFLRPSRRDASGNTLMPKGFFVSPLVRRMVLRISSTVSGMPWTISVKSALVPSTPRGAEKAPGTKAHRAGPGDGDMPRSRGRAISAMVPADASSSMSSKRSDVALSVRDEHHVARQLPDPPHDGIHASGRDVGVRAEHVPHAVAEVRQRLLAHPAKVPFEES